MTLSNFLTVLGINFDAHYCQEILNIASESMPSTEQSQTLKNMLKLYISNKRKRHTNMDLGPAQPDEIRPVKLRRHNDSAD